jgi:hypothetical protein
MLLSSREIVTVLPEYTKDRPRLARFFECNLPGENGTPAHFEERGIEVEWPRSFSP